MRGVFARFARDQRGVASIVFVLVAGVLLTMTAAAVDFGYVYLQTRKLQGVADLAAMAAAEDISNAKRQVARVVAANGYTEKVYARIVVGTYVPDSTVESGKRFVAGGASPNAVEVSLKTTAPLFFGAHLVDQDDVTIVRTATAANAQLASFSIGSRLLSFNGGVANALLSGLTGSKVSLTVMDYNALVGADIGLFDYVSALRTDLRLDAVTFDKVLSTEIDTGDALEVLGDLLDARDQRSAASAMRQLSRAASGLPDVTLGDLIDAGVIGPQDRTPNGGVSLKVNALDLADAVLMLARGGRQVKLDFGASVPGVSSIEAWLAIGERPNNSPWLAVTASGEPVLRTAQARLYINATVAGGTGIASVSLPLFVELASAEARLSKISCPAGENGRKVKIEVKTGVGRAAIAGVDRARLDDFKTRLAEAPAAIVALPLVSVTAQAGLDIGGETWQPVTFNAEDIDTHAVRTAETRDALEAVTASLVGGLKLKVTTAGLGIGLSDAAIQKQVAKALAGAAKPVDDVLNTLTGLLGVHLGEVDVRMNGVRCHATALVL